MEQAATSRRTRSGGGRRRIKRRWRRRLGTACVGIACVLLPLVCYQFVAAMESVPQDEEASLAVGSLGLSTVTFVAGLGVAGGCLFAAHRLRR